MRLKYVGAHDGVDVMLPDGTSKTVMRGKDGYFPALVGHSLLEQGPENWIEVPAAKVKVVANEGDGAADAARE